ncbi:hypothetical protein IFM89_010697 [Coptis chinensis]|uniref:GDSL esterase/lipase n=1 Tax=Coptis chinensis TaxID=261450 RepID=A0A835M892_9MAGN|nr:hypothetical protein IFM89_010697 [Coptis chinensis]
MSVQEAYKMATVFYFGYVERVGDSSVDVGNNNYLLSLARANFPPNGIDFGMPTGRFTNGRTVFDIVGKSFCQELGLKDFTPPYLAPTTVGERILHGVNYASGGGGILNRTGYFFVGRLSMDTQLDYFAHTRQDIISSIGALATSKLLAKSIFVVNMGANDFLNNYATQTTSTPRPETFGHALISLYRAQLTKLYVLGARKILVASVGPLGCIPYKREQYPSAGHDCIASQNHLASLFNTARLKPLVTELNANLEGSEFVYADVYNILLDIIENFKSYGFVNFDSACCHSAGRFGGLVGCVPESEICPNRSKFVFWDAYHPSEASNLIIAKRLMDGDLNDISPQNIRKLVQG